MRTGVLLLLLLLVVGCNRAPVIDRETFDQRYQQTALAEGVLTAVPLRIDRAKPPTVVNWWYAGTSRTGHYLVFRELTWDAQGRPIGRELRYHVPADELAIRQPFAKTRSESSWLPLYEAATDIPRPSGLLTERQVPDAHRPDPVRPQPVDPETPQPGDLPPPWPVIPSGDQPETQ